MRRSQITPVGWIVLGISAVGTLLAYLADRANVAVIAPYMDLIAAKVYQWVPNLSRFPGVDPMWVSSAIVGASILLVGLPIAAVAPFSHTDRLESQLKQRQRETKSVKMR
jgi:hypothetical protein